MPTILAFHVSPEITADMAKHPFPYIFLCAAGIGLAVYADEKAKKRQQNAETPSDQQAKAPTQDAQAAQPLNTMKHYKIYESSLGFKEAVKQGWSWPAFFFTFIWAFVKKLHAIGGGVLAGLFVMMMIGGAMVDSESEDSADTFTGLMMLAQIAVAVVFGVNGNLWREKNLISRAYKLLDTIEAPTDEAAIAIWLKKQAPTPTDNFSDQRH